jgi:hypothetical protein
MGSTGSKPSDPAPTAEERALAGRAANEWNDYLERYVPLEDQAIAAAAYDPNKTARLQGETSAMAALGTKGDVAAGVKRTLQTGAGLSGAMTRMAADDPTRAAASAGGLGAALAERSVRDRELQAKQKLTAFGRGLADQSTLGLSRLGQTRTEETLTNYKAKQAEKAAKMEAAGTALGFAASYGMNRLDNYAADWRKKRAEAKKAGEK